MNNECVKESRSANNDSVRDAEEHAVVVIVHSIIHK